MMPGPRVPSDPYIIQNSLIVSLSTQKDRLLLYAKKEYDNLKNLFHGQFNTENVKWFGKLRKRTNAARKEVQGKEGRRT